MNCDCWKWLGVGTAGWAGWDGSEEGEGLEGWEGLEGSEWERESEWSTTLFSLKDWMIRGEARRFLRLRVGPAPREPREPRPAPGDPREPSDSSDTPSEECTPNLYLWNRESNYRDC